MEEKGAAFTGQGTRLSEKSPWESYAAEMETPMTADLAAAVADYAERRYEEEPSNQTKEELCRQKEANDELSEQYQWIKPEEYEDIRPRIGRVMSHAEFITLLRKAKVRCWYRDHVHHDKAVLLAQKFHEEPEVACWVQLGLMPELSIMRFDEHGVPLNERRRGWRTPLLQLILKGYITEEKANEVFGRPKSTDAYARYNRTLFGFRNRKSGWGPE